MAYFPSSLIVHLLTFLPCSCFFTSTNFIKKCTRVKLVVIENEGRWQERQEGRKYRANLSRQLFKCRGKISNFTNICVLENVDALVSECTKHISFECLSGIAPLHSNLLPYPS